MKVQCVCRETPCCCANDEAAFERSKKEASAGYVHSLSVPSSFPEMEIRATVALDSGDGGTRRACNNENCSKDYHHEGPCSNQIA